MKKIFSLITFAALATSFANAATQVDSWTSANAWSYETQPDYATTLTINADGESTATLVSNTAPAGFYPGTHLLDGVFYSFTSAPTLTANINTVLPNVQYISVEVVFVSEVIGTGTTDVFLNFNGTHSNLEADSFTLETLSEPVETPIGSFTPNKATYVWDVSGFGSTESFDFALNLGSHDALFDIVVTQSVVPEPSTYALMFGAVALGFCFYRRRKS